MTAALTTVPCAPLAVRDLFGIPVTALTMAETIARIEAAIETHTPLHIGVINAAKVVNMRADVELRESVVASDLILADGMSIVWASRVLRQPLPERVAGIDLMHGMLRLADQRRYRVFCLGATDDVLDRTLAEIRRQYPNARIVGSINGYFTQQEESVVAARIAAAEADMLFVAMTSPMKEKFLARWSSVLNVPICHGVGGSFDVMAGKVQRAPKLWQRLGLEWLYRVKQEPGRLWRRYLVTNMLFMMMVGSEVFAAASQKAARASSRTGEWRS